MKFAQDSQEEGYVITAYDENSVSINGKTFSQSLIIANTRLEEDWDVTLNRAAIDSHIDDSIVLSSQS